MQEVDVDVLQLRVFGLGLDVELGVHDPVGLAALSWRCHRAVELDGVQLVDVGLVRQADEVLLGLALVMLVYLKH